MIVGCYTMDLYCRHYPASSGCSDPRPHPYDYFPQQYTGRTEAECKRKAKQHGWHFHRDGEVTCPLCIKAEQEAR